MSARPHPTLGDCIRQLRVQQRQIHNGRPWAQEDLAVAIGSNKSHINRIERGHQEPTGRTLQRICDALDLPWRDRAHLLSLAGYLPQRPPPTPEEIESIRQESSVLLREVGHPLRLDDDEQRLRDLNGLLAFVLFGRSRRESALDLVSGRHTVELLYGHPFGSWWQRTIANYGEYTHWCIGGLFERCLGRFGRPELPPSLHRLQNLAEFREAWDQLTLSHDSGQWNRPSHRFEIVLDHPSAGQCRVLVQSTILAQDERFSLVHYIAADQQTRDTFAELTRSLGDRRRATAVA
jgi:transcriptional regulator with XRE-family HTH domain